MNKILCVGLMCVVGASIVAGETPTEAQKSGHSSLQSSPALRGSASLLNSSSEAITICAVAKRTKQEKSHLSSSAGLSASSAGTDSSGSSPAEADYSFPGQGLIPRHLAPVAFGDPNMHSDRNGDVWPYYK